MKKTGVIANNFLRQHSKLEFTVWAERTVFACCPLFYANLSGTSPVLLLRQKLIRNSDFEPPAK